jgi:hypothetical protein
MAMSCVFILVAVHSAALAITSHPAGNVAIAAASSLLYL